MKNFNKLLPVIAGVSVSFIFGFSFLFSKQSLSAMTPFELLAHRFTLASVFLLVLAGTGLVKVKFNFRTFRDLIPLALLQPLLYFSGETYGIKLTSVSESSLVIALIPVATALLGVYLLKEKVAFSQWLYIFLSVIGIVVITLCNTQIATGLHFLGVALLMVAVAAASFFAILSRHFSRKYSPFEITFVMMLTGAVFFNAAYLFTSKPGVGYFNAFFHRDGLLALLYLGLLSSVAAFFLLNFMLTRMKASEVTTFVNLTTAVSVAAGVVFRGESFGVSKLVGGLLIIAGVWGVNAAKTDTGK